MRSRIGTRERKTENAKNCYIGMQEHAPISGQEAWDRRQETGNRRRETGNGRQEMGNGRQETGD